MPNPDFIKTVAATTETALTSSPFQLERGVYQSTASFTAYGVNLPQRSSRTGLYQRFTGDGATTSYTSAALVNLANAHVDGGSLAAADVLRVVVLVNKVPLHRVAAGASPSAGQFKTSGSSPITLTFGSAPALGALVEMFLISASTSSDESRVRSVAIVANIPKEAPCYEIVYGASAFTVKKLTYCN